MLDVEISNGFLQVAEALQYLHTVRKKLHMNVSPENIVLTPGGEWKLCGLGFSLSFANDENKIAIPYYLSHQVYSSGAGFEVHGPRNE